ncbi:serine protease [Amycolatopsis sp.]|jgi:secreted trypsin-like serine protease|uniref:serine protease n=1 Tax=Amycolatopsis sp. TaxID=37632 RepID=UPI002DFF4427|nr:serine protease [Amycolatopsis sp.]
MIIRRFAVVAVVLVAALGNVSAAQAVVGGRVADVDEFPFALSLQRSGWAGWSHTCGAVLLKESTAVTAAPCVEGHPASLRIRYGSLIRDEGEIVAITSIERHDDLALLTLASPLPVAPVALADVDPEPGTIAEVVGWGETTEGGDPADLLRVAEVPIVGCGAALCAGAEGVGACAGDHGGPLLLDGALIGVLLTHGCGRPDAPDLYARPRRNAVKATLRDSESLNVAFTASPQREQGG